MAPAHLSAEELPNGEAALDEEVRCDVILSDDFLKSLRGPVSGYEEQRVGRNLPFPANSS